MIYPTKQYGMTFISLVFVIGLAVCGALLFLKLYPPYYGFFKLNSAVNSLKTETRLGSLSDKEIKDHLLRRLQIDDVDEVTDKEIVIEKTVHGKILKVAYEVSTPIVGNLYAVTKFNKTVELGGS